jgi:hypothetical protein
VKFELKFSVFRIFIKNHLKTNQNYEKEIFTKKKPYRPKNITMTNNYKPRGKGTISFIKIYFKKLLKIFLKN